MPNLLMASARSQGNAGSSGTQGAYEGRAYPSVTAEATRVVHPARQSLGRDRWRQMCAYIEEGAS